MSQIKRVQHLVQEGYSEEEAYAIVKEEINYSLPLDTKISNIINDSFINIEELQKELNNYKYILSNITEKKIIEEVFNSSKYHYLNGLIISNDNNDYRQINQYVLNIDGFLGAYPYYDNNLIFYIFFFKKLSDSLEFKPLNNLDNPNIWESFKFAIYEIDNVYNLKFNIDQEFFDAIAHIGDNGIYEIFDILKFFDSTQCNDEIFIKYLMNFAKYRLGHRGFNFFTNSSLTRLMVKLLDIEDGSRIYDPFGASAELLIEALHQKDMNVSYNETNRDIALIAYMNFILSNNYKNMLIKIQDPLDDYDNGDKYDYILSQPPFRVRGNPNTNYDFLLNMARNEEFYNIQTIRDLTPYYLIYILSKLNNMGKAVIVLPQGFFFSSHLNDKHIKDYLLKNDLIEAIVALPSGIIPSTAVITSLLVLNKNKNPIFKNKIKFIDANIIFNQKRNQENILDVEEVLNTYLSKNEKVIIVENETVIKNDYNLTSNRYQPKILELQALVKDEKSKYMKDLVVLKMGKHIKQDITYSKLIGIPFIKIKDLKKDILDMQLLESDVYDRVIETEIDSAVKIDKECILIARLINQLKPTIFRPTEKIPSIFIDQNVYALMVKEEVVSIEYLYYQLYTKLLIEQVEMYTLGKSSSYSMMNKKQLETLIIPYVSLFLQQEYIDTEKETIISQEESRLETRLKLLNYEKNIQEKESDIVRVLVHQLRPTFSKITMGTQNLRKIIELNNLGHFTNENKDKKVDNILDAPTISTLDEISSKIYNDFMKLEDTLSIVEKIMNFSLGKADFIVDNICMFFREYIKSKENEINSKYTIELKCKDINVEFNKKSFEELLDQLLLNAEKHAFVESKKYKIKFQIKEDKQNNTLIIEYRNNGKKFTLTKEKYIEIFTKSKTTGGSGIGGNYINRIIEAHNGDLFIPEQEEGFYLKIVIPLNQNREN